jgi:hypothetical protein
MRFVAFADLQQLSTDVIVDASLCLDDGHKSEDGITTCRLAYEDFHNGSFERFV